MDDLSKSYPIQRPQFQIGDIVARKRHARSYWRRKYLYHLVRKWRIGKKRLSRTDRSRALIRACLAIFDACDTAEIVGVHASSAHIGDTPGTNECYINDIPGCSSGVRWEYQLMFRYSSANGKDLALVTGCTVVHEYGLSPSPAHSSRPVISWDW